MLIDRQTMQLRVASRTNNTYGHSADQLAFMHAWYAATVAKYNRAGVLVVDAEQTLSEVLDDIFAAIRA